MKEEEADPEEVEAEKGGGGVVGWPKAPATRVHTTIGGSRFGLGLARTA